MGKILIAAETAGLRDQMQRNLSSKHEIACAQDGAQAWNLVTTMEPELLVLDMELPGMDGITFLKQMYSAGYHPAVIVVARLLSDYAIDTLGEMGVKYLMRKPCKPQNVADRAEDILCHRYKHDKRIHEGTLRIMEELGIPSHLHGAKYLPVAAALMNRNPSQYITKELYPAVGKRFNTDGNRVERSIRHAIAQGFDSGRQDAWIAYFGQTPEGAPVRPKNAAFILRIVELLNENARKQADVTVFE